MCPILLRQSEFVSISDAIDKIDFSSRFFKDKLSRYLDLFLIIDFEFNSEFKILVVFIGPEAL